MIKKNNNHKKQKQNPLYQIPKKKKTLGGEIRFYRESIFQLCEKPGYRTYRNLGYERTVGVRDRRNLRLRRGIEGSRANSLDLLRSLSLVSPRKVSRRSLDPTPAPEPKSLQMRYPSMLYFPSLSPTFPHFLALAFSLF